MAGISKSQKLELSNIAVELSKSGNFELAIKTAQSISDDQSIQRILLSVKDQYFEQSVAADQSSHQLILYLIQSHLILQELSLKTL